MCFCFSGEDPDREENKKGKSAAMNKFYDHPNKFQINMCDAITKGQPWCCLGTIPCFICCVQYKLRQDVLEQLGNGMADYICCQGYAPECCGLGPGKCGEKSTPELCLCCEICCCPGLAVSASRMTVMDAYTLRPDECDNKLIRFNNCIQCLSIICDILAMFLPQFRDLAHIIDLIADIVFFSTVGCMTGQVHHELEYQKAGPMVTAETMESPIQAGQPAKAEEMER